MDDIFFSDFSLVRVFQQEAWYVSSSEIEKTQIFKNSLLDYFSITTRFMYMHMPLTFQLQ